MKKTLNFGFDKMSTKFSEYIQIYRPIFVLAEFLTVRTCRVDIVLLVD